MVQTMFQRYGFAGVQVQIQAVLTLYSQGRLSTRRKLPHKHHIALPPLSSTICSKACHTPWRMLSEPQAVILLCSCRMGCDAPI